MSNDQNTPNGWPERPGGEKFPEVLNVVDVAMLLRYDAVPGMTLNKAARDVRALVRDGLPTVGKLGRRLLFRRDAVLAWLSQRGGTEAEDAA